MQIQCVEMCMSCSVKPIIDYIDQQYENYLQEELKIKRSLTLFHDTRIHACIYFISPTGHSYDEFMRRKLLIVLYLCFVQIEIT